MTKKLNVNAIASELEGSVFFPGRVAPTRDDSQAKIDDAIADTASHAPEPGRSPAVRAARTGERPRKSSKLQTTKQLTNRSTGQSIVQLTRELTEGPMAKPKGFYISEQLDARLDYAVRYFQTVHGIKKVDRSILLNALLADDSHWKEDALDELTDRLIDGLTRRLTGR